MSITDELRKEAHTIQTFTCMAEQANRLLEIADRIDAEHERVCYDYQREFDDWKFVHDIDFVELPKDVDSEYIHVGDMMERGKARGHVIALMLSEYPKKWGGELHWGVQLEGEQAPTALDGFFRHYHEPTVEDVLREFGDWYAHTKGGCDEDGIIAEYAAKLRLADDGEGQ